MKNLILLLYLILIPSGIVLAQEDDVFAPGKTQLSLGLSGQFTEDYSLVNISGEFGYFFTGTFVAGPGLGLYIPSDNSVVYEPMVWGRYFVLNRKPVLPFVGLNTGYIYSPHYTYHTSYSIFCDASVEPDFQGDEATDTLSILRLTPQAGVYYFLNDSVILVGTLNYNMLRPVNESPADGYTLEDTNYATVTLAFSIML
ncbi:MAG: hypothetical protein ACOC2H_00445 [Spirochaetota bacterium]